MQRAGAVNEYRMIIFALIKSIVTNNTRRGERTRARKRTHTHAAFSHIFECGYAYLVRFFSVYIYYLFYIETSYVCIYIFIYI